MLQLQLIRIVYSIVSCYFDNNKRVRALFDKLRQVYLNATSIGILNSSYHVGNQISVSGV